jgi:hypothetical protein
MASWTPLRLHLYSEKCKKSKTLANSSRFLLQLFTYVAGAPKVQQQEKPQEQQQEQPQVQQ